jgi:hypothetical protein
MARGIRVGFPSNARQLAAGPASYTHAPQSATLTKNGGGGGGGEGFVPEAGFTYVDNGDGTVTITDTSGSNRFGTKNGAAKPVYWADFNVQKNPTSLGTKTAWDSTLNGSLVAPPTALAGISQALRYDFRTPGVGRQAWLETSTNGLGEAVATSGTPPIFVQFVRMYGWSYVGKSGLVNFKAMRLWEPTGSYYTGGAWWNEPNEGAAGSGNPRYRNVTPSGPEVYYPGQYGAPDPTGPIQFSPIENVWLNDEYEYIPGSGGVTMQFHHTQNGRLAMPFSLRWQTQSPNMRIIAFDEAPGTESASAEYPDPFYCYLASVYADVSNTRLCLTTESSFQRSHTTTTRPWRVLQIFTAHAPNSITALKRDGIYTGAKSGKYLQYVREDLTALRIGQYA